jgi:hypothetical protein
MSNGSTASNALWHSQAPSTAELPRVATFRGICGAAILRHRERGGGPTVSHVAYGDESSYNTSRFRSVAIVTATAEQAASFSSEVRSLLDASSVRELKWSDVKDVRRRSACERVLSAFLSRARVGELRIDVLVWDIEDARHTVPGRDDNENLARMYYHLCRSTFRQRWPTGARWGVYPDEFHAMKWPDLYSTLRYAGRPDFSAGTDLARSSLQASEDGFAVIEVAPVTSHDEPLVQVADVFAGLAVYSRTSFDTWRSWHEASQPQLSFEPPVEPTLSNRHAQRCPLVSLVNDYCKSRAWTVALSSTRGFETRDWSRGPVNFWFYRPQHEDDRAPTRITAWGGPEF